MFRHWQQLLPLPNKGDGAEKEARKKKTFSLEFKKAIILF